MTSTSHDSLTLSPRVWAPPAGRVALHHGEPGTDPDVTALRQGPDGWWSTTLSLPSGTDYAFAVDGGEPRPDPRSPWQPYGVHGSSRTFAEGAHTWQDAGWAGRDVRGAVVYELHLGTFTSEGTLDAACTRLQHLVDLGVDMVELMPVAAFPGNHGWGYDGVALYAVHEPYGGPAALQRFVDAAHGAGLAVCLDVVYNHLGPSGNYLSQFGPYFTDRHHTPWGMAVNLDGEGSTEVRAFVVDNALRWLRDFHVDALRLDAVHALVDDSPRHLLVELTEAVEDLQSDLGRPLSLIAESDLNDATMVTPVTEGGLGMTAQWADDVHHAVHAFVTGETHGYYGDFAGVEPLAKVLTDVFLHDGTWSSFRGQPWGRPVPPEVDGHRFVVFASDHDQVGNRALGDRPSQHLDGGTLATAAALVLTSPFTPMIFMGEEWGATTPWQFFTDHSEAELVASIRKGRTDEFGGHGWTELYGHEIEVPDPQAPSTVEDSRLDWDEPQRPDHARLLSWYRTLVGLRRSVPDLASGDRSRTRVRTADDGSWLVVARGDVRVVITRGEAAVTVDLAGEAGSSEGVTPPAAGSGAPGGATVLAAWDEVEVVGTRVTQPARSVAVVRLA